jgi:hypothetical protein
MKQINQNMNKADQLRLQQAIIKTTTDRTHTMNTQIINGPTSL